MAFSSFNSFNSFIQIPATTTENEGGGAGVVSILAGSTYGYLDATGIAAKFAVPYGITIDSTNTNLYVADTQNYRIRKIVISTGVVTTLAGSTSGYLDATGTSAKFDTPFYGITIDSTNTNLYVGDEYNIRIRKIVISTGVVTTLAGSGVSGYLDATGTAAKFETISGITIDSTNTNLYVVDTTRNCIRKIVISTAVVTTLAGSTVPGYLDATGTSAKFFNPIGITIDSTNTNLYVADKNNNLIRKIVISTGVVTTLAGSIYQSGYLDGIGTSALFNYPTVIQIDSTNTNLYVVDNVNLIRKIVISTGVVTTLAGSMTSGYIDATGTSAKFDSPSGITTGRTKTNLYIADSQNNKIRQITL